MTSASPKKREGIVLKTGIALLGEGEGAVGVWQAMCALDLADLPLMAADDTAVPLLCRLLCQKYGISSSRRRRLERGGAAARIELLRLLRWLRKNGTAEPLKKGTLLFYFPAQPLLICAPGSDVFLSGGKQLCGSDHELLGCVMKAARSGKKCEVPKVWPLCAAGAEKTAAFLLNLPEQSSEARAVFPVAYSARKPERATDEVFRQLWQRRAELYEALLF